VVNTGARYKGASESLKAMRTNRRQTVVLIVTILALLAVQGLGAPRSFPLVATANGEGTLKVGHEEFKVSSVVVKLLEDGKAEITLVSDITIFVSGTWSGNLDTQEKIGLVITGTASSSGLEGDGKLLLRDDKKTVATLELRAFKRQPKRNIVVNFTGK
jgi:hypothetical protein